MDVGAAVLVAVLVLAGLVLVQSALLFAGSLRGGMHLYKRVTYLTLHQRLPPPPDGIKSGLDTGAADDDESLIIAYGITHDRAVARSLLDEHGTALDVLQNVPRKRRQINYARRLRRALWRMMFGRSL